jgi:hypothetical protein
MAMALAKRKSNLRFYEAVPNIVIHSEVSKDQVYVLGRLGDATDQAIFGRIHPVTNSLKKIAGDPQSPIQQQN